MAAPVYAAAGAGAVTDNGVADLSVPYPTGIAAAHLLLLQAVIVGDNGTVSTPAGWTLLHGPDGTLGAGGIVQYVFAKSAVGSESGNLTVVTSGDATGGGRMYRLTDWLNDATMANNFEGASLSGPTTSTTIADAGVTTTAAERLACQFIAVADDNAIAAFAGETGGDWAEAVAEYTDASNLDFALSFQIATMASAGTIDGGTITMASDMWVVRGFAILPAAAAAGDASVAWITA